MKLLIVGDFIYFTRTSRDYSDCLSDFAASHCIYDKDFYAKQTILLHHWCLLLIRLMCLTKCHYDGVSNR